MTGALACAGLALALFGCARGDVALDLVDVTRGDLVIAVDVTGELAAVDSTDIQPPVIPETSMFKLSSLAAESASVATGDPIVAFETSELDRNVEAVESQIAEATTRIDQLRAVAALADGEAMLGLAELDAGVAKAALVAGAPPELVTPRAHHDHQVDAEQARAELALATQGAAHARRSSAAEIQDAVELRTSLVAQLAQLRRSLPRLAIASPRAGTVVYPTLFGGTKRKVGDSVYVSEVVFQIVGLGAMVGRGDVDEVELARLAIHEPVVLRLDAAADVELHGTLQAIAGSVHPRSAADPSNVVRVEIAVAPAAGAMLRPGMRFRGQIEAERIAGVVQVPVAAVFVTPDGPVAYRAAGGVVERVALALGRRSADAIEVTAGLVAGDRVSRVAPAQGAL